MKIAVVGGSNSVLKDSYVNSLSLYTFNKPAFEKYEGVRLRIDNKAIGMTNSLYALLQLEKYNLLHHNDVLIHEYFVNDNNHFFQGINSPERTRKTLLTIIQQCIKTQKKLLLLMIYNRADKIAGKYSESPIFTIYTDLIKHYNIPFIDMYHVLYLKAGGQWPLYYRDDTHLSLAGMSVLKDEILQKLPTLTYLTASRVNFATDIYQALSVVSLVSNLQVFKDAPIIKTLKNSLVNISYLVITDAITLNFDKATEILAVEYVCDQRSGYIEISTSTSTSTRIQKNTLKTERLVLVDNKPIVSCITFNVKKFDPATSYTIQIIQPKDLHPSYYDREKNTYETLHTRETNFKIASLLVTNKAKLIL